MELITNIIVEYLKYNKRLCVPKLGTFIVKQTSGEIKFSDLMRNDDGVLRSLLLAYGVKELEAKGMMDRFVFEVHHAVAIDGKFAIATLGEFTADVNNTITFKQEGTIGEQSQQFNRPSITSEQTQKEEETQKEPPKKRGGNIKPPVEEFEQRKSEHERLHPRQESDVKRNKPQRRKKPTRQREEESDITLSGKPEAYLRGLKYDSNKNKKREDGGRSSRGSNPGSKWIIILLFVVVVGAVLAIILWPKQETNSAAPIATTPIVEERDSLQSDTLPAIDSLIISETTTMATNITNDANPL